MTKKEPSHTRVSATGEQLHRSLGLKTSRQPVATPDKSHWLMASNLYRQLQMPQSMRKLDKTDFLGSSEPSNPSTSNPVVTCPSPETSALG